MTLKRRDEFREQLLKLAHSFNASLGQFLFVTAAFLMILSSISGARMTYLFVMAITGVLAWIYRADLRS